MRAKQYRKMAVMENRAISLNTLKLGSGYDMPALGLTANMKGSKESIKTVIDQALSLGCRCFDTCGAYCNDSFIGQALKELLPLHNIKRDEIFIIRKLQPCEKIVKENLKKVLEISMKKLGIEHIDLILLPGPRNPKHTSAVIESWQKLASLYDDGVFSSVGVSNFSVDQLRSLVDNKYVSVIPCVNQITEWNPHHQHLELLNYCQQNEIILQSKVPVAEMSKSATVNYEATNLIANQLEVTPDQVRLLWNLQNEAALLVQADQLEASFKLKLQLSQSHLDMLNKKATLTKPKYRRRK